MLIHVVRPGDSIPALATRYGVDPARLATDNSVPPDGALAIGQTLVVQFPREIHTVRPGETLTAIAARYGLSVRALLGNNWQLQGNADLRPGQMLVLSYFNDPLGEAVLNGYAYPFIDPALLTATLPYLTHLSPFTYGITADGSLLPLPDEALLTAARAADTAPLLHLSTLTESGQFSSDRATLVLTDAAAQDRLVARLLQTLQEKAYDGVDVDFEYIPPAQKDAYAAFLRRLRKELAPLPLWTALAPKTAANQRGLLYEAHDYAALGAAADRILLMTYEWGYTAGPPMAVAPLPKVRAVLDYAVTEIPAHKLLLGIPNYGYDWQLPFAEGITRAQSLSNQRAIQLAIAHGSAIQYDETAQAPYFYYRDNQGAAHVVWFEDARSLEAKLRLIPAYGFAGAGIWNIMRPFSQLWLVANALLTQA
ncbi:MAG: glycosyl hydrolase family 18 protein [Oscillospiraceae bacterium]